MAEFTFSPLTPTAFLDRAAQVFGDRPAISDGPSQFTYAEFADRSTRLAGALRSLGVQPGDRVGALCVNSHVMLELHNGVPYAGAVLVPMNIRLSTEELSFILEHSGAKILIASQAFAEQATAAAPRGLRVVIASGPGGEYEERLAASGPCRASCDDERGLLAISYTSGTTGRPKGVMYHHRGAYLQALAMAYHSRLDVDSRYLWTLPQFHCSGWCFTWAVTAGGGTHVCLPAVDPVEIWRLIISEGITHFSAAPTVLNMIASAHAPSDDLPASPIHVDTGGAPPSPRLLARMAELRMSVTHLYGLTETFGPAVINQWRPEWDVLSEDDRALLRARQGVGNIIAERVRVVDDAGVEVPADGETIGQIVVRGNDVMLGYYGDEPATTAATIGRHFQTGDLAVVHPDGYVEIRDRAKDIIISGGENIASVEVERVLDSHPDVSESAVVARPHELWGEVVTAFVELRPGSSIEPDELIDYARERLAHFKAPKQVIFGELPKTSTGKIQKHVLRDPRVPSDGAVARPGPR